MRERERERERRAEARARGSVRSTGIAIEMFFDQGLFDVHKRVKASMLAGCGQVNCPAFHIFLELHDGIYSPTHTHPQTHKHTRPSHF